MTFVHPHFLWLLIPLILLSYRYPRPLVLKVHLMVLMLLVLSLSRPVFKSVLQQSQIEAKDIIIALDVSYSMQADDIKPTRYAYAKETINTLLEENPTDNIMLMAFTSNPLLLSPSTTDHKLISIALESLNPQYILTKGTSLEALFNTLASMGTVQKQLILITDGGEEKDLQKLQSAVEKSGVTLTLLALGTTKGTTVAQKDGSMLKDKDGHLVISRINPLLKALTDAVHGTYVTPSSSPKASAKEISQILQNNHTQTQKVQKMQQHYFELYSFPLTLAALLFLMIHTKAAKYLVALFILLGMQAHASMLDTYHLNSAYKCYENNDLNATLQTLSHITHPSLQSQVALAGTYYKLGNFKKSIQVYKAIRSTSPKIKQQLYYNIANAYSMQKKYSKAKIYYTKALQLGMDKDAQHNLALIALLEDAQSADLGIAHPKSQDSSSSKSDSQEKKETQNEDTPSASSGGGGESKTQSEKTKKQLSDEEPQDNKHPLSSKVYELINKGYIRETQPW